jgi:hypothetical protein
VGKVVVKVAVRGAVRVVGEVAKVLVETAAVVVWQEGAGVPARAPDLKPLGLILRGACRRNRLNP